MNENMLNFTVGPVQMNKRIREIGYEQVPYFRTEEFSNLMLENETLMKEMCKASDASKVVFMTGSGTASMEASIINTLTTEDKVLIVNGGSFGERFVDICKVYNIPYDEIKLEFGKTLTQDILDKYNPGNYTTFVVNKHETSTGVHYDMELISKFCEQNNLFLIVDAISSFLADPIDVEKYKIDIMITGSQKALACPPGISIIVLSERAQNKIYNHERNCVYLDLKAALDNARRGQTPFTPAVGILRQINARLNQIKNNGGVESEIAKIENIAKDFRNKIKDLPLEILPESQSNAVTALKTTNKSANEVFLELKNNYNIWVCPNGGSLKDLVFRVGHIGDLTIEDNDKLIDALKKVL